MRELKIKVSGNGSLDPKLLSEFEDEFNVKLPEQYREFMIKYNGGYVDPCIFNLDVIDDATVLKKLYPLKSEEEVDLYYVNDLHDGFISDRFITIGNDPGGSGICLGVKGDVRGKVYFFDRESDYEDYDEEGEEILIDEKIMYLLSDTFYGFLDSLYEDEED